MKNKFIVTALIIFVGLFRLSSITYSQSSLNVYLFYGEGCPHCAVERQYLDILKNKYTDVSFKEYEVWYNKKNLAMLESVGQKLNIEIGGVPFLLVGDKYIVGYMDDATTGAEITNLIDYCRANTCKDLFAQKTVNQNNSPSTDPLPDQSVQSLSAPRLPTYSGIDLNNLSLPLLTVFLGFLDGFNPCAMWTLLFLISLLVGMQDKKRMWALGIAFITASAFVYFLFMVAWLKLFQFLGLILWVRILIAGVALFAGFSGIRKFFSKDPSGCDVSGDGKRQKVFDKIGQITTNKSFLLSLIGIIFLAFAVNLVELVCSAGFPAVYTQILSLNSLTSFQYYSYILLYILFFMLDDLFVFFTAMITLRLTGITTKYVKYSKLVGGIIMLAIGMLLLFKPDILM